MYYIIVNPRAGGGRGMRVWRRMQKALQRPENRESYELFLTEKTGDARNISRQLTERCQEERTIVVVGGDGTLNEVVDGSCLDRDRVSIIFVPSASGNDFAKIYRKRYRPGRSLRELALPEREMRLDYGVLDSERGNRRFVVSSGIGFDAALFQDMLEEEGRSRERGGFYLPFRLFAYFLSFVRELRRAKKSRGALLLDAERRIEFNNVLFISAHVHPYEGGCLLASGANGSDGCLDLCVVSTRSKHRLIRIMIAALFGFHKVLPGVHCYRCRRAEISMEEELPVHTDGEAWGRARKLSICCVPGRLRIRL